MRDQNTTAGFLKKYKMIDVYLSLRVSFFIFHCAFDKTALW